MRVDGQGGTILTLQHRGLADAESARLHNEGWASSLDRIDRLVTPAGPIPGHRNGDMNAAFSSRLSRRQDALDARRDGTGDRALAKLVRPYRGRYLQSRQPGRNVEDRVGSWCQ